ncbi:hypothetical protein RIF29_21825 [Crotalaria pallida]|uniref:Pentatricopeptide repeat-containing protein n=1 Tax=Crotalaria pallida TaxID=3830 RepID=A0AAN9I8T8_CROPI
MASSTLPSSNRFLHTAFYRTMSKFPTLLPNHSPTLLMRSFTHSNDVDQALESFKHMLCVRYKQPILRPPIIEFNKILVSLVKLKEFATAISLFKQLDLKGIRPDMVTFNTMINCFFHITQLDSAFSVFANILKIGYHPDVRALKNTMSKGLYLNGGVEISHIIRGTSIAQPTIGT